MLALVTADNLVQLFFGWEGVGLMSYLLIGFCHKPEANAAAIKAFIVNRWRLQLRARHLRRVR
jgi:NADH-quinone oxidoreductase subunit L